MTFRERNLQLLAARHPVTHAAVGDAPHDAARVRLAPTASGLPTAVVDGIYVHSRYDPARDAAAQVEREVAPESTAVVVLGFGLGYGAEAVRAKLPQVPLLVVEPDVDLFRAAVSARDLGTLLEDRLVSLHVGAPAEGLPALLETMPLAKPCIMRLRSLVEKNPTRYRAAEEVVHSWLLRRDINVNTLNRFGRLWVRNLCRNIPAFAECPGVSGLSGMFSGVPALILAGGPSLDAIIPALPALRERFLVVAVNTPLAACKAAGVEPDFAVVIDPQYWASRYLDWATGKDVVLVAEPSTNPRVFHRPRQPVFLCSSLFPLGETLESALGEKGKLGAGGSVATSAWDLARLLGAHPLYAAGLDLGFPGFRTHCRGVYAEDLWLAAAARCAPVEGASFRSLREIGLFYARSASGGLVATDRRMLLYKWWFENQLVMRPEVKSFRFSPEGVAIDGMPIASLDEALSLPVLRPRIDSLMAAVRAASVPVEGDSQSAALEKVLGELAGQMKELGRLARRGLSRSRELGKALAGQDDPRPCLRALDEVDRGILDISARSVASFLLQSIIHEIAGAGERTVAPQEVVERSITIYRGIAESATWHGELLARARAGLRAARHTPGGGLFSQRFS